MQDLLKTDNHDEQTCNTASNSFNADSPTPFHTLFHQIEQVGAREQGLGSMATVQDGKLCTCPFNLPYPHF